MVYRVITEATARQDALEYATYIIGVEQGTASADKWLTELEKAIDDLSFMPRRFARIAEERSFSIELRQFTYHSHRVVFHVNDESETVHVLRIYHARRDAIGPEDVPTSIPRT